MFFFFLQLNAKAQRKAQERQRLGQSQVQGIVRKGGKGQGNPDDEVSDKRATEVRHPGVETKERRKQKQRTGVLEGLNAGLSLKCRDMKGKGTP